MPAGTTALKNGQIGSELVHFRQIHKAGDPSHQELTRTLVQHVCSCGFPHAHRMYSG
jgi:hypothetical protein